MFEVVGECGACDAGTLDGELHEVQPEVWVFFCLDCVETLELDCGK